LLGRPKGKPRLPLADGVASSDAFDDEIKNGEVRGSANARGALGCRSPRDETYAAPEPAFMKSA